VAQERFPEAAQLAHTCLTLPVDQRYGSDEIERLGRAVKAAL
jgi:dTDP-4-amino-4,6-dideoxygalactose transaminase